MSGTDVGSLHEETTRDKTFMHELLEDVQQNFKIKRDQIQFELTEKDHCEIERVILIN